MPLVTSRRTAHVCPRRTLRGHEGPIRSCCLLPTGIPVSGGEDGSIRLWDAASGAPIVGLEAGHPVNALQAHAASGGLWEEDRVAKGGKVLSLSWGSGAPILTAGPCSQLYAGQSKQKPCHCMPAVCCEGSEQRTG